MTAITLWIRRNDGRVGWSYAIHNGAKILSFHKGWKCDYVAGCVGDNGWQRARMRRNDEIGRPPVVST